MNSADILLLEGLRVGDKKSFEALFVKYYPRFYNFILHFVKNEWVAEDITQNIFAKLWINRSRIELSLPITTYLYTLAKYEIYNHFRAKHTQLTTSLTDITELTTPDEHSFEDQIEAKETDRVIAEAIEKMPPRRREVFRLSRFEYLSSKEIAERTGLSPRTVEKHIELAMRQLREIIHRKH